MRRARLLLALLTLAVPLAASELPRTSGKVVMVAASPQLLQQIEALPSHTWAGYALPAAPRRGFFCDYHGDWNGGRGYDDELRRLALYFHVEDHRIDRVRVLSDDCTLDAESLTWFEKVSAPASLALMRAIIASDRTPASKHAVMALAMHDDPVDALIDVAKHHPTSKVRSNALFWLSEVAGRKAAGALRDALDNDPDDKVRASAVFGISNLPDDESIPILADLMRTHRSAAVRKKAAFWLGQKKDPRALAAIEGFLKQ
jgi:hypothetical protein